MAKRRITLASQTLVPGLQHVCTLKESAASCTRCNACAQSCPVYLQYRQESFSPRGRMQLMRLISEGKLTTAGSDKLLADIANSCMLCARCTNACAGKIPVAHHMLALRKALGIKPLPAQLYFLLYLRGAAPKLFDFFVRGGLFLYRTKLPWLLRPLLPDWLKHAQTILPRGTGSLRRLFAKKQMDVTPNKPKALYFPSLYAQYIDPQAGLAAYQAFTAKKPTVLFRLPSGLFEHLYGSRTRTLQQAKKVLQTWEQYSGKYPLPFITDSIELYGFFKNYPLLFATVPGWQQRAEKFAAHVQFVAEAPFPIKKKNAPGRAALDSSSVLYPAGPVAERARKLLLTTYGKNLVECEYSRFPLPAASMGFTRGSNAGGWVLTNTQDLARQQIDIVYCLSAWAALELNAVLRRRKSKTQARFVVYIRTDYERT
ncbi:MAG: (Fe-S)-binding protein [Elusimicrobiaceae bacterium]|nr:(Fe-S)-binding protein [Elusimicrobiaceae bacterium]